MEVGRSGMGSRRECERRPGIRRCASQPGVQPGPGHPASSRYANHSSCGAPGAAPMILGRTLLFLATAGLLVAWHFGPEWPIFQALVVGLFATAIIGWVLHRFDLKWSWMLVPVLAIPVWPAAQLACGATAYRSATIFELLRWSTYAAVFVLSFWSFHRHHQINWLLRVLIVFSLLLAAEATMQHFAGNGKMLWLF